MAATPNLIRPTYALALRHEPLLQAALLVALALGSYWGSLASPFIFDDFKSITLRPSVHSPSSLGEIVQDTRRPVYYLSLAANYAIHGDSPWGYRAVNVTIHVLAALILFDLIRRTLTLHRSSRRAQAGASRIAFASSALWCVHPIQTESVTYIAQRCESLMGLFFLLGLYAVVRSATSSHKYMWLMIAIVSCFLGMGTKEVMAVFPLIVIIYDRTFLADSWRCCLRERWPLYAVFGSLFIGFCYKFVPSLLFSEGGVAGFGVAGVDSWTYLRTEASVVLHYLRLSFWPTGQCLDYSWPLAKSASTYLLPVATVSTAVAFTAILYWHKPKLAFLPLCFFIILAPTSSFVPIVHTAFEHRMYLPLAAVCLGAVLLMNRLVDLAHAQPLQRFASKFWLVSICLMSLIVCTRHRNTLYASPALMWTDVVSKAPHNWAAYNNLGVVLATSGEDTKAIKAFAAGLDLNPNSAQLLLNLGKAHARGYDFRNASNLLRRAVELAPNSAEAHWQLGNALLQRGRRREALAPLSKAVALNPRLDHAAIQLAWISLTIDKESLRDIPRAQQLLDQHRLSNHPDYLACQAAAYAESGQFQLATASMQLAIRQLTDGHDAYKLDRFERHLNSLQRGEPIRERSLAVITRGKN